MKSPFGALTAPPKCATSGLAAAVGSSCSRLEGKSAFMQHGIELGLECLPSEGCDWAKCRRGAGTGAGRVLRAAVLAVLVASVGVNVVTDVQRPMQAEFGAAVVAELAQAPVAAADFFGLHALSVHDGSTIEASSVHTAAASGDGGARAVLVDAGRGMRVDMPVLGNIGGSEVAAWITLSEFLGFDMQCDAGAA